MSKIMIIAAVVLLISLVTSVGVFIWVFYTEIARLDEVHKKINNMICDYEDELEELHDILMHYYELTKYSIPLVSVPENMQWVNSDPEKAYDDEW